MGNTGKGFPELCRQQEMVEQREKNVYMISTSDVGDRLDIHPKRKQPVAKRMSLKARYYVYKEEIECEHPKAEHPTIDDGSVK